MSEKTRNNNFPIICGGLVSQSQKSIAKHLVKHTFGNLAITRAVRKGALLRGMVSQGRPDPLRHSFMVLRSDSAKEYLNFSLAILFGFSVISGLARPS